ncbi:UNKNOWN [Stylonychia lemnae]|uniref:Uncharacterized protein n=1 Tax=Stylonychia lemnae TaxID=5949 RepID=A0A078BCS7_STYLE|nr:UNKNOWN [Stylonychia lemnae]|eukprot:CDW91022.1 UNKNOWN [Stylonychia lemnae]
MESKTHSQYQDESSRYVDQKTAGRRLRVDGNKRTEEELRQMLRLAEVENKELKDSLRYVEIQLAKTRENYTNVCKKYEEAQEEIQKCHEQINRQTNINHAQAQQIEEMGKKMDEFVASQKEMYEKSKFKVSSYQNEIDIREEEINRLKRQIGQRDEDISNLNMRVGTISDRMRDIEEELELKSGENNRLRNQVADLEKTVQDLYVSRKGDGSFQVELDKLKADNERLILLLQNTCESEVLREAKSLNKSNMNSSFNTGSSKQKGRGASNERSRGKSAGAYQTGASNASGNQNLSNEWIPTEAVRAIQKIKEIFNGQMTETCVSQILYELNGIWRAIMRKENEAIKKKLTDQIQDLRRQLITKRAFDEEEAHKEISRLKKELQFAQKQSKSKNKYNGSAASSHTTYKENDQRESSANPLANMKQQHQKNDNNNQQLKNRITQLEKQRLNAKAVEMMGALSNSDEISSGKYGGGIRHRQDQQMTMNDEQFSGKNIFNYQQNVLPEGKGGLHGQDNMSHSFNYSDYS